MGEKWRDANASWTKDEDCFQAQILEALNLLTQDRIPVLQPERPRPTTEVSPLFLILTRLREDPGMRLVGRFGDGEQVIATE